MGVGMKVLFLIHDLGQGGAEKVLVNLVNNMDHTRFDVTVTALFGGGVNEQFLSPKVKYKTVFPRMIPGNSKWMKLFTSEQLHRLCVKEEYDVEISYLEGPSARVISGCRNSRTKLVSWIHVEQHNSKKLSAAFRNQEEAIQCYNRFHQTVCVSEFVKRDFTEILNYKKPIQVLYNTVESDKIKFGAMEPIDDMCDDGAIKLVAVGSLKESKGFGRLLRIVKKLKIDFSIRLYILGIGPLRQELEEYVVANHLQNEVVFLGYQTNPYKYVSKCDLFVCSSFAEGFSTAVTESLIVGTPVCTVEVSGMKELLGNNNEYGVVTENTEEALYDGIKSLLSNPERLEYYRAKAKIRGTAFNARTTVLAVEDMLDALMVLD